MVGVWTGALRKIRARRFAKNFETNLHYVLIIDRPISSDRCGTRSRRIAVVRAELMPRSRRVPAAF